jgi:PIN like domain
VPSALRAAGHVCELHDDKFDQQTEDAVWLGAVASRKLIVLTKDDESGTAPSDYGRWSQPIYAFSLLFVAT